MEKFNAYRKPLAIALAISAFFGVSGCGKLAEKDTPAGPKVCVMFTVAPNLNYHDSAIEALKKTGANVDDLSGLNSALETEKTELQEQHTVLGGKKPYIGNLPFWGDGTSLCVVGDEIEPGPDTTAPDPKGNVPSDPLPDILVTYPDGSQQEFNWPKK